MQGVGCWVLGVGCRVSMERWRYPRKLCLNKYELDKLVYNFENRLFQLWFTYKNELRISIAGKHIEVITLEHFKPRKITISFTLLIR